MSERFAVYSPDECAMADERASAYDAAWGFGGDSTIAGFVDVERVRFQMARESRNEAKGQKAPESLLPRFEAGEPCRYGQGSNRHGNKELGGKADAFGHENQSGQLPASSKGGPKAKAYVIQGVKGELYPCKPDIFAATYEAAE